MSFRYPSLSLLLAFQLCMPAKAERLDFNLDVRPLLSDRCFKCHGFDENSREAGLRILSWRPSLSPHLTTISPSHHPVLLAETPLLVWRDTSARPPVFSTVGPYVGCPLAARQYAVARRTLVACHDVADVAGWGGGGARPRKSLLCSGWEGCAVGGPHFHSLGETMPSRWSTAWLVLTSDLSSRPLSVLCEVGASCTCLSAATRCCSRAGGAHLARSPPLSLPCPRVVVACHTEGTTSLYASFRYLEAWHMSVEPCGHPLVSFYYSSYFIF